MADINSLFPSQFLRSCDLPDDGQPAIYTIKKVDVQEVGDNRERKPCIEFVEDCTMVLNKTNANILAELLGRDYTRWVRQRVALKKDRTSFQGKVTDCIRVSMELPGGAEAPF